MPTAEVESRKDTDRERHDPIHSDAAVQASAAADPLLSNLTLNNLQDLPCTSYAHAASAASTTHSY